MPKTSLTLEIKKMMSRVRVKIPHSELLVAEPVAVGDEVQQSAGLGLATHVVSIGGVVARREQCAGQLGGSALAIDVIIS